MCQRNRSPQSLGLGLLGPDENLTPYCMIACMTLACISSDTGSSPLGGVVSSPASMRALMTSSTDRPRASLDRLDVLQDDEGVGAQPDEHDRGERGPDDLQARVAVDRRAVLLLLARAHPELPDAVEDDRLDEDEDLFSPVPRAWRRRLIWLTINLGTAFLAAGVVDRFEDTIHSIVALAALMPIVAGMGGNAGTQVLALMVRGLALGQVGASNFNTLLWKEIRIAMLNGLALGLVLGLVVWAWHGDPQLSLVIATALTINLLLAASAGVLIPLTLKRFGFDPALASGIFLTTVTDVMGFFTFLGLATVFLLH